MIRKYNGTNLRISGSVGDSIPVPTLTTDIILQTAVINPNTFVVGDCIKIRTIYSKTNNFSTTWDLRLHWSPNGTLTGSTQLALYSSITTDTSPSIYRTMTFKPSNQAFIYSTGTSAVEDVGIGAAGASGTTLTGIDITSTGYIIASAQRTSGSARSYDTLTSMYLTIEV
jgi:hypothetical protein